MGVSVGVTVTVLVGVTVGVLVCVPVTVAVGVAVGVPAGVEVGVTVGVGDGTGQQSVPGQKSAPAKGHSPHGATVPDKQFSALQESSQPAASQLRVPVAQPQKNWGFGSEQNEQAQQQAVGWAVAVEGVATVTLTMQAATKTVASVAKVLRVPPVAAALPAPQPIPGVPYRP